jgi:hypothetical protein
VAFIGRRLVHQSVLQCFAAFLVGGLVVVALPRQGYFLAHENEETYGGRQTQLDMRRRRHIIVQIEMWLSTVAISTSLTVGRRAESWTLPNLDMSLKLSVTTNHMTISYQDFLGQRQITSSLSLWVPSGYLTQPWKIAHL